MDTNVTVSAIGWSGPPSRLLEACLRGKLKLSVSPAIPHEVAEVLARPKLAVLARHPDLPAVLTWLHHDARASVRAVGCVERVGGGPCSSCHGRHQSSSSIARG